MKRESGFLLKFLIVAAVIGFFSPSLAK